METCSPFALTPSEDVPRTDASDANRIPCAASSTDLEKFAVSTSERAATAATTGGRVRSGVPVSPTTQPDGRADTSTRPIDDSNPRSESHWRPAPALPRRKFDFDWSGNGALAQNAHDQGPESAPDSRPAGPAGPAGGDDGRAGSGLPETASRLVTCQTVTRTVARAHRHLRRGAAGQ